MTYSLGYMHSLLFLSGLFHVILYSLPTKLYFLCSHPSPTVLIPALRTVGNIVTGDDIQTQVTIISSHSYDD